MAPVQSNGWILTGEVGKIVPVSNARISSVEAMAAGGLKVGLKGAAGEVVAMGGAKVDGAGQPQSPVYSTVTIGPDGTADLHVGGH